MTYRLVIDCKLCIVKLLIIAIIFDSCNSEKATQDKIVVKKQLALQDNDTLYWFIRAGGITSEGPNYFQTATSKSELCIRNANAYCENALNVYSVVKDTIYILTPNELYVLKESRYVVRRKEYLPELFDRSKSPRREEYEMMDQKCED